MSKQKSKLKSDNKTGFFKWCFSRWAFWVVLVLFIGITLFTFDLNAEREFVGYGLIGSFLGAFFIASVAYWMER